MKRRFFNLAAGASLLLFILTAVGWAASHQWFLATTRTSFGPRKYTEHEIILNRGRFWFRFVQLSGIDSLEMPMRYSFRHDIPQDDPVPLSTALSPVGETPRWLRRLGVGWAWNFRQSGIGLSDFTMPCWPLMLLAAPLPGVWFVLRRRERKALAEGVVPCPACGYDLRGSPAEGACPECGQARAVRPN